MKIHNDQKGKEREGSVHRACVQFKSPKRTNKNMHHTHKTHDKTRCWAIPAAVFMKGLEREERDGAEADKAGGHAGVKTGRVKLKIPQVSRSSTHRWPHSSPLSRRQSKGNRGSIPFKSDSLFLWLSYSLTQ